MKNIFSNKFCQLLLCIFYSLFFTIDIGEKMIIPNIVERNFGSEKIYDIYSKLLKDRIIFINGEITDSMSHLIISQLLYLDSVSSDDISIYINSPGGSVTAGLSIYDCMNYIKSDVSTVATDYAHLWLLLF